MYILTSNTSMAEAIFAPLLGSENSVWNYFHSPNIIMQLTCVVVGITRRGVKITRFAIFTSPWGKLLFPIISNY